jgi:hypothetical protein
MPEIVSGHLAQCSVDRLALFDRCRLDPAGRAQLAPVGSAAFGHRHPHTVTRLLGP